MDIKFASIFQIIDLSIVIQYCNFCACGIYYFEIKLKSVVEVIKVGSINVPQYH